MRCLKRNKQKIYYASDEQPPVEIYANVSASTGHSYPSEFGSNILYHKIIQIEDINAPITEHTVFCIDKEPSYNEDNELVYDYIVKQVAKSINNLRIAVARVDVS